ncbi:hypothetical protein GcM1_247165 [Golovinomyces cichoracearum]|uniref:Uncharacterized protein n=1 Tax=Golovinomyces cichoracearum TaxID=62708 RepID=A0A420HF24_9PEZI|nr:hypothetical protein GcC1_199002 [Golovinomyces cichoracearum]RKF72700.1 hypothetical protein GcM1_247165 [Golovinomyces cichoracearum]
MSINSFVITSPLDQFEIRNFISLDAPLFGNIHLSLTNIVNNLIGMVRALFPYDNNNFKLIGDIRAINTAGPIIGALIMSKRKVQTPLFFLILTGFIDGASVSLSSSLPVAIC